MMPPSRHLSARVTGEARSRQRPEDPHQHGDDDEHKGQPMAAVRRRSRRIAFRPVDPGARQADRHPPATRPDRVPSSAPADRRAALAQVDAQPGEDADAAVLQIWLSAAIADVSPRCAGR